MSKVLSKEAIKEVGTNAELFAMVAKELEKDGYSLSLLLKRNSKSLNTWHTVDLIAKAMNKNPDDVLTKTKTKFK